MDLKELAKDPANIVMVRNETECTILKKLCNKAGMWFPPLMIYGRDVYFRPYNEKRGTLDNIKLSSYGRLNHKCHYITNIKIPF